MKQTPLRRTDIWSCGCCNDRIHLKRSTPVGKELTWQPQWSRRISTPIEIWEHHLGKVWIQHLTLKQLKYHNSKQNKGLACRNKPEQIQMIEIYPITNQISAGGNTRATWIPTYETPETFRLCNQVLGIQGKHNISPKTSKSYIQLYPSFNT